MIKLESLTIKYMYGSTGAKDISLECARGERIAILAGEEGGKTSLLKCIAGLYPATGGRVYIDGADITRKKIKERDILLVHTEGGIIKTRTVRANLELPLKIRKYPKEERQIIVGEAAKNFGILPILDDYGYKLSDDDKLRVALARTAIRTPAVIMFDDVFRLAPHAIRKAMFLEYLPKIRALRNSAVLFATTSLEEALSVGDRILVMNFGIAEQLGTPGELKEYPASVAVDKMINPYKNRLTVSVSDEGNGRFIRIFNKLYRVPCPPSYAGREVICSFSAVAEAGGRLPISDYFYDGDALYIRCGGIVARAGAYPSDRYDISVDIESIRLFDVATEKALTF
ncbi:MAG: ABC transporter ATP-binding protein [Clostridiales bacterium]|jgi:ABC-type sugar transport system ATPase subunit|nr:ABC transporter ATP-binding protein [Clostridiales bacterium]